MRGLIVVALLFSACASSAYAQDIRAVVRSPAPIFLLPDANRTPITNVPEDTTLTVIEHGNEWAKVEFRDPVLGRRVGWIATDKITILKLEKPSETPKPVAQVEPAIVPTPRAASTSEPERPAVAAVAVTKIASTPPAPGAGLSETEVLSAIAEGAKAKRGYGVEAGLDSSGSFSIFLCGPYGRIVNLTLDARSKFKPLAPADVPTEVLEPFLYVRATPGKPEFSQYGTRGWRITPAATHMVLLPKVPKSAPEPQAVQPTKVETFPYEWSNALGGKFTGQGIVARFNLHEVPAGDFLVVVVTPSGPVPHQVKAKDREWLK